MLECIDFDHLISNEAINARYIIEQCNCTIETTSLFIKSQLHIDADGITGKMCNIKLSSSYVHKFRCD